MRTIGAMTAALIVLCCPSHADEKAALARKLVSDYGNALVTVKLTIKENFSSEEFGSETSEYVLEAAGTVIGADGLVVASLSETDPSQMMEAMYGEFSEEDGMNIDTQVSDLKIVMADGTEVPGHVVIRDVDLDLALIRPLKKPEKEWTAVKLDKATTAEQFDEVFILYRMGKVTGRTAGGDLARIISVMEKPRKLYVIGAWTYTLGTPAFTSDGACLGIVTLRTMKATDTSGGMLSDEEPDMADVILPVADLLDSAAQAPGYEE